jgi:phospholipase/lecithinase/hemolysin
MSINKTTATFLLGITLAFGQMEAYAFSGLYAFGDSLSDMGSSAAAKMSLNNTIGFCDPAHPCPPYDKGRISNGQVAIEYVAQALNIANVNGYAVAGSTSGIGNYIDGGSASTPGTGIKIPPLIDIPAFPGMKQQLDTFAAHTNGIADPNALYFVWGGSNDLFAAENNASTQTAVDAASNITKFVGELAGMGAQHIVVANLPNLGLTPEAVGDPLTQLGANSYSVGFNQLLAGGLNSLYASFPTLDLVQFDTYSLFNQIYFNPALYGFTNVTDACFDGISLCATPDSYLFMDNVHPTTRTHEILGAAIVSAVPLSPSMLFFVTGIFGWLFHSKVRVNSSHKA